MSHTTEKLPTLADFKFIIDQSPTGETEAFIPVRWCLSREAVDELAAKGAIKPQMIILVVVDKGTNNEPRWCVTYRKVVDVGTEMTYVRFNRAGNNKLVGIVAWGPDHMAFRQYAMTSNYIVDPYSGTFNVDRHNVTSLDFVAEQSVNVPAGMFAKEPSGWQKALVRKFFKRRESEQDECDFKGHFLTSVGLIVPYLVFGQIVRLVQLIFGLWLGVRRMNYSAVVRPFKYDILDVTDSASGTWWKNDREGSPRPVWWWLINPITIPVGTFGLFGVSSIHMTRNDKVVPFIGWSLKKCFYVVVSAHLAVILLSVMIAGVIMLGSAVINRQTPNKILVQTKKESVRLAKSELERKQLLIRLEALACDTGTTRRRASFDDLPEEARTISLRFDGLKKQVCRPFQR